MQISEDIKYLGVDPSSLKLDPENARVHDDVSTAALKDILTKVGQQKPIVIWGPEKIVIAGNGVLMAARELGATQIAAIEFKGDEREARLFALMDNRSAELSEWDLDKLKVLTSELDGLKVYGFDDLFEELEVVAAATALHLTDDRGEFMAHPGEVPNVEILTNDHIPQRKAYAEAVDWGISLRADTEYNRFVNAIKGAKHMNRAEGRPTTSIEAFKRVIDWYAETAGVEIPA